VSSIAARFRERVGRLPLPLIPLHDIEIALNDNDKGLMGLGLNNPPDGDEPQDDNPVNGGSTLLALPLTNKSVGNDNDDDAPTTARGSTAAGSNATTASATALDRPVDGSNAPPASTSALDSPVDGSNVEREGDSWAAGATGDDENPVGDGTGGDFSIPSMQQSAFFPMISKRNDRIGGSLATASTRQTFSTRLRMDRGQFDG
jgi:hypothetical protein